MAKAKKKIYYAYFVPRGAQGVTDNWVQCEKMVKGVAGARFKGFPDRATAERWLVSGAIYAPSRAAHAPRLATGIYFDAGTGRGEGVEISVTDEKGINLLHKVLSKKELNQFGKQLLMTSGATNNYGELLALRYALQIAKKENISAIFGDSKLVIEYWSRWRIKKKELPEETVRLAAEVAKLREAFEAEGGAVQRISGDYNPADLGFHK